MRATARGPWTATGKVESYLCAITPDPSDDAHGGGYSYRVHIGKDRRECPRGVVFSQQSSRKPFTASRFEEARSPSESLQRAKQVPLLRHCVLLEPAAGVGGADVGAVQEEEPRGGPPS